MKVMAIGNRKGGSAKTTATVQLAAAAAQRGHRVLVVDLDPQANASRRLGFDRIRRYGRRTPFHLRGHQKTMFQYFKRLWIIDT